MKHPGGREAFEQKHDEKMRAIEETYNSDPAQYYGSYGWVRKPWSEEDCKGFIRKYGILIGYKAYQESVFKHIPAKDRAEAKKEIDDFRAFLENEEFP